MYAFLYSLQSLSAVVLLLRQIKPAHLVFSAYYNNSNTYLLTYLQVMQPFKHVYILLTL